MSEPLPEQGAAVAEGASTWDRNFQQCLDLLRGPQDERRFVGLLLVTRLLPKGSDEAVRAALGALGFRFLQRLLLPLSQPRQATAASADESGQHATGCGLALAILAAGCRLPEVAAGAELMELLPLLLRVVHLCGVSPLLGAATSGADAGGGQHGSPGGAADFAAVTDALECLVAAAAAAPQATLPLLEREGALEALASWLAAAAAVLTSEGGGGSGGADAAASAAAEAAAQQGTLLAAALLERLMAGANEGAASGPRQSGPASALGLDKPAGSGGVGRGVRLLAEAPAAAARAMASLAAFVGNPRLLRPAPAAPPAPTPAAAAVSPPPQHGDSSPTPKPKSAAAAAGGGGRAGDSARSAAAAAAFDPAQLQLESLHVLLLMLRAAREPAAAAAAAELVLLDEHERTAWSAAVRRGLGWLLRSRAPGPLRHAALQAAALVVELAGERWLLGRGAGGNGVAGAAPVAAQERPEAFLLLLTETLKVELGLLLQDALHPLRRVPGAGLLRSDPLGLHAPPQPSQRLLDELAQRAEAKRAAEEAAVRAAAGAAGIGGSGGGAPRIAGGSGVGPMEIEGPAASSVAGGVGRGHGGEGKPPSPSPSPPPAIAEAPSASTSAAPAAAAAGTMAAGERALALLPACFQLLEACVGAVAADAEAADGVMDVDGGAAGAATNTDGPVLPDSALQKLLPAFDAVADTVAEFLEAAAERRRQEPQAPAQAAQAPTGEAKDGPTGPSGAQGAGGPAVSPSLQLGAVRLLGRYLAEAPAALRREQVLRALPVAMAVRVGPAAAEGGAAGAAGVPGGASGHAAGRGSGSGEEVEDGDDEGFALAFLLPGLLQATSPGAEGRSEVLSALRASPAALTHCVAYLAHCVSRAAAALPHLERLLAAAGGTGSAAAGSAAAGSAAAGSAAAGSAAAGSAAAGSAAAGFAAAGSAVVGSAAHAAVAVWEQGLADVCALLLNVLEPPVLGGGGAWRRAAPGTEAEAAAGRGSFAWATFVSLVAGSNPALAAAAEAAAAAASQHLPPLLAALLPACWLVAHWAGARGRTLQAVASLDIAASPTVDRRSGSAAVELSRAQLSPRALLCSSCLGAVVLCATMHCLSDAAQQAQEALAAAVGQESLSLAAAAAAILPPPLVDALCSASLAAAAAGASLELAELRVVEAGRHCDVAMEGEPGPAADARWLTPASTLEDYPGDGELAWARLLGACAQLAEMSAAMRRLAHGSVWLRRLASVRVEQTEPAVANLVADVNVALLLQVLAANT